METLDYIFVGLFSLTVLTAGMSFRKSGANMKSFFAAGGAVPWSISGLSLFMSFFSAGTFVVWGSIAYEYGLVSVTIQWMMCLGGVVVGALIAPAWRKTGALTAAEFIRNRLGEGIQKFYTLLILLLSLAYMGAFLYPVARIVNVSTGIPITTSVVTLGVVVMAYTMVGGLWAVIITDVLQFVVLTVAVVLVIPIALEQVDGLNNFVANAPTGFFNLIEGEYTPGFLFAFAIYNAIFIGGNWAYVQRYTSVASTKSASKVGYLFTSLYAISPILWMLPPMIYRTVNPGLEGFENEGAYLMACKAWMPAGILGLMLGGMIFATASSVNTNLNLSAAVFTNDVFKPLRPNATNKQTMWVARASTFLFGIGTILVALLVPAAGGIVEVVLTIGAVTGCSLYGPPIWAMFSKRHTGNSILACTLIGLAINLGFKFLTPWFGFALDRAGEMLVGAISPFALLVIYELWAALQKRESSQYKKYLQLRNPGKDRETMTDPRTQNRFGLAVLANTLAVTGLLLIILSIFSSHTLGLIIGMGSVILLSSAMVHPRISLGFKRKKNDYRKP